MIPIPEHLAGFDWYAPHLAWLAEPGLTPRHDPGGAEPWCADLSYQDLACADLSGADLTCATSNGANLTGADLEGADLEGATLCGASLCGADLTNANLRYADLTGAVLDGANLTGATMPWGAVCTSLDVLTGTAGGYWWCAHDTEDGPWLTYGCEAHPLSWWLQQDLPSLSVQHGEAPRHARYTRGVVALVQSVWPAR